MLKLQKHITTVVYVVILACTSAFGQTLEEDYNNGSISQRESDCWEFDNYEINSSNPINASGGEKKHGATVNMDSYSFWSSSTWFSEAGFTTPFIYFDGTGSISFKHKADVDDYASLSGAELSVVLIDPYGNRVPSVFDHVYKQTWPFTQYPNGAPEDPKYESVGVTWTGYYRVEWQWSDGGDAATEYFLDDLEIDTSGIPFVETATVCLNEVAQHTPSDVIDDGAPYYFEYWWSWEGTAGGTLTTQTTNNRTAQVDWNAGAGTYRLKATETYDNRNCNGRTFYIDVTVLDAPTFTLSVDTVCEGEGATMLFEGLLGDAPYTITYNDGTGPLTVTTSGSSDAYLLDTDASSVDIISVEDNNGCEADAGLLIAYPIYYYPSPATGPVYHY